MDCRKQWLAGAVLIGGALAGIAAAGHVSAAPPAAANKATKAAEPADKAPLTEEQRILHALSRLGFGPRPGDVERVKATGLSRYVEEQLHPERVRDVAVEDKLAGFKLLKLDVGDLREMYLDRQSRVVKALVKQQKNAQGQAAMVNGEAAGDKAGDKGKDYRSLMADATPEQRREIMEAVKARQEIRQAAVQLQMDKIVRAAESERQFQEVMVDFWSNHFNIDMRKKECATLKIADERDVIRKHAFGKFRDLLGASAKSPAMLVYLDNYQSTGPVPDSPRLRRFQERQMEALDKAAASGDPRAQLAQAAVKNRGRGGLNENYAREIMELHTLGVDGGYTQKDVTEVARCLTGWTIDRQNGEFRFTPFRHDSGAKTVLGRAIPAGGGMQDGETVLDMLASNPSTMRFISTKLCRRLVADEPPATLVDKCVAAWKRTDGDLREVYRTIVTSPEFYSRAAYRQKIKSPFEYAVSAVRAVGGTFDVSPSGLGDMRLKLAKPGKGGPTEALNRTLIGQIVQMGQPLYQYQAPTGYSEDSRKWVSSGALVSRLNFSLALTGNRLADVDLSNAPLVAKAQTGDPAQRVSLLATAVLHGEMTPATKATLMKEAGSGSASGGMRLIADTDTGPRLLALVLGSPEFQRH